MGISFYGCKCGSDSGSGETTGTGVYITIASEDNELDKTAAELLQVYDTQPIFVKNGSVWDFIHRVTQEENYYTFESAISQSAFVAQSLQSYPKIQK